jgi:hypothetical protein
VREIVNAADNKRFRVVVVGVAKGQDISAQDLAGSLQEYFPLPPDAQVAIETGRSAVVQVAESEQVARRAATMLIRLGAEIRIEPDGAGPGHLNFDDIDLESIGDNLGEIELDNTAAPKPNFSHERTTSPVLVDRPPVDDDAPTLPPQPSASQRTRRPTRELDPVQTAAARARPDAMETPADWDDQEPAEADETEEEKEGGQLVRCPAHGLLYNATQSAGCTRCLGTHADQPFRLAPELRQRPRLWLTLGLALGLLLGAVPAALYAQNVKSGALYERRIEADTLRNSPARSKQLKRQLKKARAKITATRNRGIALSALLWIGVAAALMLLWYRFV